MNDPTTVATLLGDLSAAIDDREQTRNRAETAAAKALHAIMQANGWVEIQVDVEELSMVEAVTLADGTIRTIDVGDEEDAEHAAGNCARGLFSYRRNEYRATLDEVADAAA